MKIVDNKGRIFGLVNVIDLAVIILCLAVIGSMVSGAFIKGTAGGKTRAERTMMLKVVYRDVPEEIAENKDVLKPGDADMFGNARVESVAEVRPGPGAWRKERRGHHQGQMQHRR